MQSVINWFLDLIFPIRCVQCGKFGQGLAKDYICIACLGSIPIRQSFECIGCKHQVGLGITCFFCKKDNALDQLLIVTRYDNLIKKILKLFKYRLIPDTAISLNILTSKYLDWLEKKKAINILQDHPLLIPVPLSKRRLNWRGFNQSEILAELLAKQYGTLLETNVLVRKHTSKAQADIEERQLRLGNVTGLFTCSEPEKLAGRNILLMDDVCTTGATLNECAKVLKSAGAKKVSALVIARG